MSFLTRIKRRSPVEEQAAQNGTVPAEAVPAPALALELEISPNDPIVAYFQAATGPVAIDSLEIDSPALERLKEAGVQLAAPLVSQGELVGVLNLGPRLSGQDYSSDDRKLLDSLASQAAPALQVAQLVRRQEAEARSRERIEQELRVATLIQQNFLPKHLPDIPGWQVTAHYKPAREVGGDFYDFLDLADGQLGIVIGDVTDKGVPAAMVMAATRSVLRASAQRIISPGEVLGRVNDLMCPDMPPKMFVTCLYGTLDVETGRFRFANAGHNLPYVRTESGTIELRATGMPLGLLPGIEYEEAEGVLEPGQTMLLHSDGVAEAHSDSREMFGFPRLMDVVGARRGGDDVIGRVLAELESFTPVGWEQEDDITLVAIRRDGPGAAKVDLPLVDETFSIPSVPGNERMVAERVAEVVAPLGLEPARLDKLKTAVAEAAMNAIEHGNESDSELSVGVAVLAGAEAVSVRITDRGGARPVEEAETPDLEKKLEGLQKPRGWGLFLIQAMVDDVRVESDGSDHTIELIMQLGEGTDEHH
jgi:serine phosphatase RsbU (regulator of sigma subunit)/anti-sigma regulatory factor (Ser/Thr protein kinase)